MEVGDRRELTKVPSQRHCSFRLQLEGSVQGQGGCSLSPLCTSQASLPKEGSCMRRFHPGWRGAEEEVASDDALRGRVSEAAHELCNLRPGIGR